MCLGADLISGTTIGMRPTTTPQDGGEGGGGLGWRLLATYRSQDRGLYVYVGRQCWMMMGRVVICKIED